MSIMGVNAITVPIYPSQRSEEILQILRDCEPKVLILEDQSQWDKWQQISGHCPFVSSVVMICPKAKGDFVSLTELASKGSNYSVNHPGFFEHCISRQTLNDTATIIYTSGTTGVPKGVVITHLQVMSEVNDVLSVIPVNEQDSSLTFLPYAHVLGRLELWASVVAGYTLNFAENIDRLRTNMLEVKPTFLIAVPRIFEKIYGAILTHAESNPISSWVFSWGMSVGRSVSGRRLDKEALSPWLATQFGVAQKTLFSSIKNKLGGRLRFAISGGAPLSREIAEFFHAANILILEGYGLTESTGAIVANSPLDYRFGTVGKPIGDVEIKFASDGEILVKSDKIMKEYYNRPEETAQVMRDGYFATGDIGEIDSDGFLKITDRKKDLIKTAGGKYIAPQKLEALLKQNSYVGNVLIYGDAEKYIVALITLNQEPLIEFARAQGISYQDFGSLTQHPQVKGLIRGLIADVNNKLSSYETIKNFAILPHDFTIAAGELTPSLKVKRKFCSEKYKQELSSLYN